MKSKLPIEKMPLFITICNDGHEDCMTLLQDRRMLCPNCLTDRHFPYMSMLLHFRYHDGVKLVNDKYVVTNPWTEEDRQRQKDKLAEKRIYMDEWDMSGTHYQHARKQRPGKRKTN